LGLGSTTRLVGELTFNGTVSPESPNTILHLSFGDSSRFPNVPTIIHAGTLDVRNFIDAGTSSGTVTLDPGVVFRGRALQADFTGALLNRGLIVADRTSQFAVGEVFEFTAAPITNQGTLAAVNRAVLQIDNLAAPSDGTVSAAAESTVAFTGSFAQTSAATVSVDVAGAGAGQV